MGVLRRVLVMFMRFVPNASLTSRVANSQDNAGKLHRAAKEKKRKNTGRMLRKIGIENRQVQPASQLASHHPCRLTLPRHGRAHSTAQQSTAGWGRGGGGCRQTADMHDITTSTADHVGSTQHAGVPADCCHSSAKEVSNAKEGPSASQEPQYKPIQLLLVAASNSV